MIFAIMQYDNMSVLDFGTILETSAGVSLERETETSLKLKNLKLKNRRNILWERLLVLT